MNFWTSPGFGGLTAAATACVAYAGIPYQAPVVQKGSSLSRWPTGPVLSRCPGSATENASLLVRSRDRRCPPPPRDPVETVNEGDCVPDDDDSPPVDRVHRRSHLWIEVSYFVGGAAVVVLDRSRWVFGGLWAATGLAFLGCGLTATSRLAGSGHEPQRLTAAHQRGLRLEMHNQPFRANIESARDLEASATGNVPH